MNISREKVILLCLVMAIVILLGVIATEQVKIQNLETQSLIQPEPKIIKDEYTLIHYPNSAWANAIYITEYYLDGQAVYYKEKDSKEYKPIWFSSVIFADGWLEGEALKNYGYWTPEDIGLN